MSIEFRCSQCGKLLRVPDGAAGRSAKCPACARVQTVPERTASAPGFEPRPVADQLWQDALPAARFEDSGNPYAAPRAAGAPSGAERRAGRARRGPPWERDGASLASFFATVRDFFLSPLEFFSQMRREGGPRPPLSFAAAGSFVGSLMFMTYWFIYTLLLPKGPLDEIPADPAERVGYILGMFIGYCCCSGAISPLIVLCYTFCSSALVHLTLLMLGSATCSFETTFRVGAYATGCTMLISILPLCGFYLAFFVQLAYLAIGLKRAHEITAGAAAAAVLLPTMLCGGGFTLVVVVAVSA